MEPDILGEGQSRTVENCIEIIRNYRRNERLLTMVIKKGHNRTRKRVIGKEVLPNKRKINLKSLVLGDDPYE